MSPTRTKADLTDGERRLLMRIFLKSEAEAQEAEERLTEARKRWEETTSSPG